MRRALDGSAVATMVVLCCTWALQQIAIKAIADTVSPFFQVALRSGVTLTFAGIAVALLMEMPGARTGHALFGDFLALCGGVVWGATTVAVRISRLSEAPPTQTLFYQLLGAFVLLLPVSLATGQVHGLSGLLVWASLAFQTLIVSVVSFLIWFGLLRRYVAAPLGILCLMTPLIGVVLGSMILKERLTTPFISGTVLALTGLLIVSGSAIARRQLAASRLKG
ncbi:DMT family transporter [Robbsia sp. KACC 23696]|uniref:DMT family transporter n=1 Tax=Robbsia sp. KACC 23696 TaxID=3149231 RepID=UPI00325B7333